MRLGWLQDPETDVIGGAELSCRELLRHVPEHIEVVPCPPGAIEDCDAYAVFNCTRYGIETIGKVRGKPVVKFCYDVWPHGDARLRDWLLRDAKAVVFQSPAHREHFGWPVRAPEAIMPPALDLAPFRAVADAPERAGTLWIGQMTGEHKGIGAAIAWAERHGPVDFYGAGATPSGPNVTYCGQVAYETVPALMATYERFLFLPQAMEPFCRTVAEAWAAGCELVVNENVGAKWWIDNAPERIESGARLFWELIA